MGLGWVWGGLGWVRLEMGLSGVCAWVWVGLTMFGGGFVGLGWVSAGLGRVCSFFGLTHDAHDAPV